jgi:hypothetical protein
MGVPYGILVGIQQEVLTIDGLFGAGYTLGDASDKFSSRAFTELHKKAAFKGGFFA